MLICLRLNPYTFLPLCCTAGDSLKRYQDIVICNCIIIMKHIIFASSFLLRLLKLLRLRGLLCLRLNLIELVRLFLLLLKYLFFLVIDIFLFFFLHLIFFNLFMLEFNIFLFVHKLHLIKIIFLIRIYMWNNNGIIGYFLCCVLNFI